MLDLGGLAVLDRPLVARLLLPLLQRTLALRQRRLARRHNLAVLVVLQVLLREATLRVVRRAVHDLGTGSNRAVR